jgi:hypothetical protein
MIPVGAIAGPLAVYRFGIIGQLMWSALWPVTGVARIVVVGHESLSRGLILLGEPAVWSVGFVVFSLGGKGRWYARATAAVVYVALVWLSLLGLMGEDAVL